MPTPDPYKTFPWDQLARFLETRFDALCEYLATDDDEANPYAYREEARAMLEGVRACGRWAHVSARMRWVLAGLILNARRMWERDGCDLEEVRSYLSHRVPEEHMEWVLAEVYRDAPVSPPSGDGVATVPPAPLPA